MRITIPNPLPEIPNVVSGCLYCSVVGVADDGEIVVRHQRRDLIDRSDFFMLMHEEDQLCRVWTPEVRQRAARGEDFAKAILELFPNL